MIEIGKEYFSKPYYFFLTEKSDRLSLYFSVGETISESKKRETKLDFDKSTANELKKSITNVLKSKKLKTKDQIKKYFEPLSKDELGEFIDRDGTMRNSSIPILDMGMTPHKTTDQTVVMARMTNNPVTRGYRKYYGESEENDDDVVNEVDFSPTFGYKETKDMNGTQTYKYLVKKMGMEKDEAKERTIEFGKKPDSAKTLKKVPKKIKNKKGFIDRMTLAEIEREKMIKMVEDILLKKSRKDSEINERGATISKIIKKNIESLKKMADREGITISELIKLFKSE